MHKITIAGMMLLMAASSVLAQKWEFGAVGGASIYTPKTVTAGSAKGDAGFASNFAVGGVLGNTISDRFGGEVRYLYGRNDMQVKSNGTKATMGAESHAIHYDLLVYAGSKQSKVRPFVSFGGGVKYYRGTGPERAFQPLSNLVLLTQTSEWKGLITAGAGVKFAVSKHISLRAEFKDYISQVPTKLLTPAANAQLSGWFNNFVPLFGLTVTY
jgi:opacity protein-like surface antigen